MSRSLGIGPGFSHCLKLSLGHREPGDGEGALQACAFREGQVTSAVTKHYVSFPELPSSLCSKV